MDFIPKRKIMSRKQTPVKPLYIRKQNVIALKYIDYPRLRMYEIRKLLRYELSPVSLYLTRGNKLRNAARHEIANVLEEKLDAHTVTNVPICDVKIEIFSIL